MSELTTNKSNSYLEQAAILLLCLGEEAAATVMQKLSREEVVRLSENMARLSGRAAKRVCSGNDGRSGTGL